MTKEEILEECRSIVDEVCEKYHYDREDTEGNDSLRTVLLKAVSAMLVDSPKEDRELFYQMLSHTPIVVTENLTVEGEKELQQEYLGNINQHIKEEEHDFGEYSKSHGSGAYISSPVFDENMKLIGKKSFIYVQKVSDKAKEFYGTDINVSHLIHELGHAWNAEQNQYTMGEDGVLTNRVGAFTVKYSYSRNDDGTFSRKVEEYSGLMLEEGMNTVAEVKAMSNYKGIPLEEMKKKYGTILKSSNYQETIFSPVNDLLRTSFGADLEKRRMYGNETQKESVEEWFEKTQGWQKMKAGEKIKEGFDYESKRAIMNAIKDKRAQKLFTENENVYFPDRSSMTLMKMLDNTLEQLYDLKDIKFLIAPDELNQLTSQIVFNYYLAINALENFKVKNEVAGTIKKVRLEEVNAVTQETKKGIEQLRSLDKPKGEMDAKE